MLAFFVGYDVIIALSTIFIDIINDETEQTESFRSFSGGSPPREILFR